MSTTECPSLYIRILLEIYTFLAAYSLWPCTVGKLRKQWITDALSKPGVQMLRAVKAEVDPQNVFGCGNILPS